MRPFHILGIQQIAIGGDDRLELLQLWHVLFGIPVTGHFRSETENVDESILTLGNGPHAVEIDLMEPVDPTRSPRVNDPKLNHIGLWVDDLKAAVEWLDSKGMRFTPGGIRKGASGHNVCFIHPKGNEEKPQSGQGVLIELVQAPPEIIQAFGPDPS